MGTFSIFVINDQYITFPCSNRFTFFVWIKQTDDDDATSDLGLGGEGGGWRAPQTDADTDVNTDATSDVTYQKGKATF